MMIENLLNSIYAWIVTGLAILCMSSYIVSKILREKKKIKAFLSEKEAPEGVE